MEERPRRHQSGTRAWQATPDAQRLRRIANAAHAEASEIRYEAEEAARVRSQDAEADARRRVQEARRASQELVLDRLHGLSRLSEEVQGQYRQIVEGIDAAQAIGDELRLLVETLDRATQQLSWEGSVGLAADASVDRVQ